MIGATDIFVSYKAEDRARLLPLVSALETEGFTVLRPALDPKATFSCGRRRMLLELPLPLKIIDLTDGP